MKLLKFKKRKIVISATCHGEVLKQLLETNESYLNTVETVFVQNWEVAGGALPVPSSPDRLLAELRGCTALIYHDVATYNFSHIIKSLPVSCHVLKIPYITSQIYWPSYNRNPQWLARVDGVSYIPFPCIILNKLLDRNEDDESVMKQYIDLDIPRFIRMKSFLNSQENYLRRIQKGTIFDIVDFTLQNFDKRQLFHLINHPAVVYFEMMSNCMLAKMGFDGNVKVDTDPMECHQIPIHPSVVDFFNIKWCTKSTVYNVIDKKMNFHEYVAFYIQSYRERQSEKINVN